MRRLMIILLALLILAALAGCVPGDGKHDDDDPADFWWGMWHGFIAVITLIWSFFSDNVRLYEVHNTGWWYDLGFMIPLFTGFTIGVSRKGHGK
ncbi:MAG: hypothetical protein K8R90_03215 [Candidatus Cloacimonetes bacterium]|nr:hypothetical protein [Candidatus Cloacimonadota bacterium]